MSGRFDVPGSRNLKGMDLQFRMYHLVSAFNNAPLGTGTQRFCIADSIMAQRAMPFALSQARGW